MTASVTDENKPRKAMLGSVLKGPWGFELDLRGSSHVLDEKQFKVDILQKVTGSQKQWATSKRPVTSWSFVCQHSRSDGQRLP